MKDKIIGVVGNGFVGGAVANGFGSYARNVRVYDINVEKRTHTLEDVLESDFVFVCLPSPMKNSDGSSSDLSYIFDFFNDQVVGRSAYNPVYILKSTVPPGTTEKIAQSDDRIKIVHNRTLDRCFSSDLCIVQASGGSVPLNLLHTCNHKYKVGIHQTP